jgi:hypothetical protein
VTWLQERDNFGRIHQTHGVTPALQAGIADHVCLSRKLWHSWVEGFMTRKYDGVGIGIGIGMSLGLGFGAALGATMQNVVVAVATGVAFGVVFGTVFGTAFGAASDAALARKKVAADKPLPRPLGL